MADAAQADGKGALVGTGLRPVPVRSGAVDAGEHGFGLLAQVVNEADVIGAPAGIAVVGAGHGRGFGFLAEGEEFIPTALKIEGR